MTEALTPVLEPPQSLSANINSIASSYFAVTCSLYAVKVAMDNTSSMHQMDSTIILVKWIVEGLALPTVGCIGILGIVQSYKLVQKN